MKNYYNNHIFNYEKYREAQILKNIKKINHVWIEESEFDLIVNFLINKTPTSCLCHGVRNYKEVNYFKDKLKLLETIGTDISPTVKEFGGIEWDFHNINTDWICKFDFVYTNSLDHSYNPSNVFDIMYDQVKFGGYLIIHSDLTHNHVDEADCAKIDNRFIKSKNKEYKILQIYKERPIYIFYKPNGSEENI